METTNVRLEAGNHERQTVVSGCQRILVRHAVLVGLTQIIPIPVLDDQARSCFRKHLVQSLAAAEGWPLSDGDLNALAAARKRRSQNWFLLSSLVYLLKAVLRRLFYFVELKRAACLASHTYHFGYLVDYAMRRHESSNRLLDLYSASEVNEAIHDVCHDVHVRPLELAVENSFRQSKRALVEGAVRHVRALRQFTGGALLEQLDEAAAQIESDQEPELEPVFTCLQSSIGSIPEEYFRALSARLDTRLGFQRNVASSGATRTEHG